MALLASLTTACGNSPATPTQEPASTTSGATLIRNIAAFVTDDPLFGIVAATATRDQFALMTARDAAGQIAAVSGVAFTSATRETLTMYFGSDGRPTKAVAGNVVVAFSNYRNDLVDLSVRNGQAAVQSFRDARIPAGLLSKLATAMATTPRLASQDGLSLAFQASSPQYSLMPFLQRMALGLQIGACVTNLVLTAASGGLFAVFSMACASALLAIVAELAPNSPYAFSADLLASLQECAQFFLGVPDPVGCLTVMVSAARGIELLARGFPDPSGCGPMTVSPTFVQIGFHFAQFDISVVPSCGGWTAASLTSWIRPPIYNSEPGAIRVVTFITDCNPNRAPRMGTVTVAGRSVMVEQVAFNTSGVQCPP